MLTKLICRNFKCFGEVQIELGNPVVFIGPNNSGKTTALQALALWDVGLKRWNEHRKGKPRPERRPGVAINRRDLISVPIPSARLLWQNLRVRDVQRVNNQQRTQNIRMDIIVEGVTFGRKWACGLEFDYANEESFYCRPLRLAEGNGEALQRMAIPEETANLDIAFLRPMSGLVSNETRLDPGAINVRVGEGRTAEVLRNLCFQVFHERRDNETWEAICVQIRELFGVMLDEPVYIQERGEIEMNYRDSSGVSLALSSAGLGLQQTLLLLAYISARPGSVLLLDEPDAHLEILRQRQIYQILTELGRKQDSQIIAASHSEVILNEAADRDVVIAFLGKPHRIDDRGGSQLLKSLRKIGFEQYYQAEQKGWVLYLEGPTNLAILQAFAEKLEHPARDILERPFVYYVGNEPAMAREHFYGLREAKADCVGFCLFDQMDYEFQHRPEFREYMWKRREIENYLCRKEVLIAWAKDKGEETEGPLFSHQWMHTMEEAIAETEKNLETRGKGSPWSPETKTSDDFLNPLFDAFFEKLKLDNLMQRTNYHTLVQYVSPDEIDPEVSDVLDAILEVSNRAHPMTDV